MTRVRLSFFLLLTLVVACGADESADTQPSLSCTTISETTDASPWAKATSPVRTYRYKAGIADNEIEIEALGDDDVILGKVIVSQVLDGDEIGTMVARLMRDDSLALTMSTRGNVGVDGFSVSSILDNGAAQVEIRSRFESTSCAETADDRLTCAGAVPIGEPEFTVGSCGLAWDTASAYGRQPRLAALRYISTSPASSGGVVMAEQPSYFVDVVRKGDVAAGGEVQKWLEESGAATIVGTADELLLTTVYNDSSWKEAFLRRAQACQGTDQVAMQALCTAAAATRTQALAGCGSAARRDEGAWGKADKGKASAPCESGCLRGDPHFVSFDGHAFDFQGVGEYVLAEATAGDPFVVQARLTHKDSRSLAVCQNVSINAAVAFEWAGKRVAIYADRSQPLWIDGTAVTGNVVNSGLPGFTNEISNSVFVFRWPGGESVTFGLGGYPDISVDLPPSRYGQVSGLLGTFNADSSDEFTPRDGDALPSPAPSDALYKVFGDSWRVASFESLFDYDDSESTQSFTDLNFPPNGVEHADIPQADYDRASAACKKDGVVDPWLFQACVLDAVCSDNTTSMSDVTSPAAVTQFGDVSFTVDGMVRPAARGPEIVDIADATSCPQDLIAVVWVGEEENPLTLPQAVEVDGPAGPTTLQAGEPVFVYLVSFDPQTSTSRLPATGSVTFSSPILGVISTGTALAATDSAFGSSRTPTAGDGLEDDDSVVISNDGMRISVNFKNRNNFDQIRVLVAAPQELQ